MSVDQPGPAAVREHPRAEAGTRSELRRSTSWVSSILLAAGAALQITIAMGPMAAEIGNLQMVVWAGAAFVGFLQCFLLAELAAHFPRRAGGTATYAHEALGSRAPWLAALSGWGYWFAWTPGIAVNLILAADYLKATVAPGVNTLALSIILAVVLYGVNIVGLRAVVRVAAAMVLLAGVPLLAILLVPLLKPSAFNVADLWPLSLPAHAATGTSGGELVIKWLFVATWSAYGAEMASSIIAEVRDSGRRVVRAMVLAGVACLIAFSLIPVVMTGLVGSAGLGENPTTVFLAPAELVFGPVGEAVVGIMLAGALILGAQAFIIGSSRTVYQMSVDGYLPRALSRVNGFGIPVMSVICDAIVIAALLAIFGTNVVEVVAAANVGYLVVFAIMPVTFIIVRAQRRRQGRPLVLHRVWTYAAVAFAVFNGVLLVAGGALWGMEIAITGVCVMAAVFPLMWLRRLLDRRAGAVTAGDHG